MMQASGARAAVQAARSAATSRIRGRAGAALLHFARPDYAGSNEIQRNIISKAILGL